MVAFFGSEGLYNFDLSGNLLWQRDLGVINVRKYGIGWGYASSPAILEDRIVLLCDDPERPFLICLSLTSGEELWRVSREGVSQRSWATPLIYSSGDHDQIVVNGWPWIVSYNLRDGSELWRLEGGGDNPVPTPFVSHDLIYVTNAHGGPAPIYAIHPEARGDITLRDGATASTAIAWSQAQGGSYMSTPVVYGDYMYLGNTNGVLRCFHSTTGEKVYEKRLDSGAAIYASLVAADDKIFCVAENGTVFVVRAGPDFELLSRSQLGDPCFATPIISQGVLYLEPPGHCWLSVKTFANEQVECAHTRKMRSHILQFPWLDALLIADPHGSYLDGNSLGRLPLATQKRDQHQKIKRRARVKKG